MSIYDALEHDEMSMEQESRYTGAIEEIVSDVKESGVWVGDHTTLTWGEVLEVALDKEDQFSSKLRSLYAGDGDSELWTFLDEIAQELAEQAYDREALGNRNEII